MNPKKRPVEGVIRPVSRVVLGSVMMDSDDLPLSFALLDYYFAFWGELYRFRLDLSAGKFREVYRDLDSATRCP